MSAVKLAYDLHIPKDGDSGLCPVITIHGLFMNKILLNEMSKKIADATGRKVYSVDLRNHGDSPSPTESNCYLMADDLILFLQDHNIPKASFICHSFSSRIGVVLAIDQPHMVEKLIFIDLFPYSDLDGKYTEFTKATKLVMESIMDTVDLTRSIDEVKAELKGKILQNKQTGFAYSFLKLLIIDCVIDQQGIRLKFDKDATAKFFQEGCYRLPPYGVYDGPVLLIMGGRSPFCNGIRSNSSETTKYFPKIHCVTISDATHLLPVEKPDECAEVIQNYLETKKTGKL